MSILDEILAHKREEVAAAKLRIDPAEMAERARSNADACRGFRRALQEAQAPAVIAEVKRRSPSKGEIRPDFDPVDCARRYAEHGAAAISVLTDEKYFGGHLDFLGKIRSEVALPLLRKDFIVEPYQVDEARTFGADAILLIVAALEREALQHLAGHARELGLDALVEVHDEEQLEVALAIGADLIGVNNRNLRSFVTDLGVTERLAARVDKNVEDSVVLVTESGIRQPADLQRLEAAGAQAFLVGESLMREADPGVALDRLRSGESEG